MSGLKNVKLYYTIFMKDRPTMGRGENIRLLLEDAGVDFEYIRFTPEQWTEEKQKLLTQNVREPTVPYMFIDGKYYGKNMPLLRVLSRKLGKYDGENEDEVHLLDAYTDMINDWGTKWGNAYFHNHTEENMKTYKEVTCPAIFKTWDAIISDSNGPFLLGERISYADFVLFHMLEDDPTVKITVETHPNLYNFMEAFKNRPNMRKYLTSDRL
ncbi:glutathione S-transferase [Pilaira anomala]|nr:glutathione S-transferase [Pilaira anomala]KAI9358707.1 glutathione S-transferase [Pilaira anomala]